MSGKILERIGRGPPHRILSLDGGGVRGIIAIAFLEDIEALLARRAVASGKVKREKDFRLAQYFDLIGGTSVGSLLAMMLALGYRVSEIRDRFEDWAPKIFSRPWYKVPLFATKFNSRILYGKAYEVLEDRALDSEDFETVVAVIAKRLDTGSPWVMTNSPLSAFWDDDPVSGRIGNRHFKLVHLVRASTAAPYYFAPRKIRIDPKTIGLFADGGLSPHNNPALQLFMLAAIGGYRFRWDVGADKLLLISVGTGSYRTTLRPTLAARLVPRLFAVETLQGLIADSQAQTLNMLQWLSKPRRCWQINSEIGDLENDDLFAMTGPGQPLFTFSRYDVRLEHEWLEREFGKTLSAGSLALHRAFDNPRNIPLNYDVAKLAARSQVSEDDFPAVFD